MVWQLADELRRAINGLTSAPTFARHAWLQEQLRRSAQSGCTNVAEGSCRFHPKDFARFLRMAKGSIEECREHVNQARALGLPHADETARVSNLANRASVAATRLIQYLQRSTPPSP